MLYIKHNFRFIMFGKLVNTFVGVKQYFFNTNQFQVDTRLIDSKYTLII